MKSKNKNSNTESLLYSKGCNFFSHFKNKCPAGDIQSGTFYLYMSVGLIASILRLNLCMTTIFRDRCFCLGNICF